MVLKNGVLDTQFINGYQIAIFNLYPVEYLPASQQISYYKDLTLVINLDNGSTPAGFVSALDSDSEKVNNYIDNPESLSTYSSVFQENKTNQSENYSQSKLSHLVSSQRNLQYVIITSSEFASAFTPLIDHKIRKGLTATTVTTEWIYANYSGSRPDRRTDHQTRIRNFIKEAYQNWNTRYVLIGGDADGYNSGISVGNTGSIVPTRDLYSFESSDHFTIPSDLYYSNLDGSFDSNANGTYGEPNDGPDGNDIDLLPEIAVGRAPVDSIEEVNNFVTKTIAYENDTSSYLQDNYFAGEYLGFRGISDYATESMEEIRLGSNSNDYITKGFNESNYFSTQTLYDTSYSDWDRPHFTWDKQQIKNVINHPIHSINHLGHASNLYNLKLMQDPPDAADLSDLTNEQPFFLYSQGCYSGAFDNWNYIRGFLSTDAIGEQLVVLPHGTFSAIVNSRYGWGEAFSTDGQSQRFHRQFWDALFGEGITRLGEMNNDSKIDNIWGIDSESSNYTRYVFYETNLLGDPETSIHITGQKKPLHSKLVFSSSPSWITQGSSKNISIEIMNIGTESWTTDDFHLSNPENSGIWNINPISLPQQVNPNEKVVLTFPISSFFYTSPDFYPLHCQMQQKNSVFFGEKATSIIDVVPYSSVSIIGSFGIDNGQFNNPSGIVVNTLGEVYVTDMGNNRIQKFDTNGNFITKWGSPGSGNGQFNNPMGIAIDTTNKIYVVDSYNNRIQKFDSNGNFITEWGSSGNGKGKFYYPMGITVDHDDQVYVVDTGNMQIQKFDSNGNFFSRWGGFGPYNGRLKNPVQIAVDLDNQVYVTDNGNNRIQKFKSNGYFLTKWGTPGIAEGQFSNILGIAIDYVNQVYVVDSRNQRIQKFSFNITPSISPTSAHVLTPTPTPYNKSFHIVANTQCRNGKTPIASGKTRLMYAIWPYGPLPLSEYPLYDGEFKTNPTVNHTLDATLSHWFSNLYIGMEIDECANPPTCDIKKSLKTITKPTGTIEGPAFQSKRNYVNFMKEDLPAGNINITFEAPEEWCR